MTRVTRGSIVAAALGAALCASVAAAQAPVRLPASDYGQTVLSPRESLGGAAALVASQRNVFEPVATLREDDAIRRLARAVGRVDLLIETADERFTSTCTGTILRQGEGEGPIVLTNHHCIPGEEGRVVAASILLDYHSADDPVRRLRLATAPVAADGRHDFAVVALLDPVPEDVPYLMLRRAEVRPRETLMLIHHPAGQPQVMTRFGCFAASSLSEATPLRHRCDTLPGSSGAPLFDQDRNVVGIHRAGGLNVNHPESFNVGVRMERILGLAPLREGGAGGSAPEEPPLSAPQAAGPSPSAADRLNDIIGGGQ